MRNGSLRQPAWRNWQTRWTQNPVIARSCGFEPLRRQAISRPAFKPFAVGIQNPILWRLGIAVILPLHQVFVSEFTDVAGRNQFRGISWHPTARQIAASRWPQPDQFLARPRID